MKCFPKSISLPSAVTKATAAGPSKTSADAAVAAVSSELDGQRMALKASLCPKDAFAFNPDWLSKGSGDAPKCNTARVEPR